MLAVLTASVLLVHGAIGPETIHRDTLGEAPAAVACAVEGRCPVANKTGGFHFSAGAQWAHFLALLMWLFRDMSAVRPAIALLALAAGPGVVRSGVVRSIIASSRVRQVCPHGEGEPVECLNGPVGLVLLS
ncbi:MAG: hypothetical protein ACI9WU_005281 [Myxococcota bacterium]